MLTLGLLLLPDDKVDRELELSLDRLCVLALESVLADSVVCEVVDCDELLDWLLVLDELTELLVEMLCEVELLDALEALDVLELLALDTLDRLSSSTATIRNSFCCRHSTGIALATMVCR